MNDSEKAVETPKADGAQHYGRENVILLDVRHERVYDGETDVLLRRERCAAANWAMGEVVKFVGSEPDWCLDRWLEGEGRLVSAVVCEDVAVADALRTGLAEYARQMAAAGKANEIPVRTDAALADSVAAHVSAEWARVHGAEMARLKGALAESVPLVGPRVLLGRWTPAADDAGAAALNKAVSDVVNATVEDASGLVYSMRLDAETKDLVAAFGLPSEEKADALRAALGAEGLAAGRLCDTDVGAICDCAVVTAAYVCGKLRGRDRAAAAKEG